MKTPSPAQLAVRQKYAAMQNRIFQLAQQKRAARRRQQAAYKFRQYREEHGIPLDIPKGMAGLTRQEYL